MTKTSLPLNPSQRDPLDLAFSLDHVVGVDEAGEVLLGHDITSAASCSRDWLQRHTPGGIPAWCPDCGSPGGCLC